MKTIKLFTVLFTLLFFSSIHAEIVTGSCGESLTYSIDTETGVLNIEGNGDMDDYSDISYAPWYRHRNVIKEVNLSDNLTRIGEAAFVECTGILSVTIPTSVISIGNYAFDYCSGLISVTIPSSVTSIGAAAFSQCANLSSVVIPNSVTSIGAYAFSYCPKIISPLYNETLFVKLPESYQGCYDISYGIKTIVGGAFDRCSSLTSVTIPNSVTSVGSGAFENCNNLISVSLPDGINRIRSYTFSKCTSLASFTIPNSVIKIEDYAFSRCSSLSSITIPNSVVSIGDHAFSDCSGITSITIPNSVVEIGNLAFSYCTGITSVTIPNSVNAIGYYIFDRCAKIEVVNWNSNMTIFPFSDSKKSLKQLYFGDDVTEVYSISGYSKLEDVVLGKNVSHIADEAFEGTNLKNFYITGEKLPDCGLDVFWDVNLVQATLYVPGANVNYCLTNNPWKDFGTILPIEGNEPESLNTIDLKKNNIIITSNDGNITLDGLKDGEQIDVYDLHGHRIATTYAVGNKASFEVQKESMLIIKLGKECIKIQNRP